MSFPSSASAEVLHFSGNPLGRADTSAVHIDIGASSQRGEARACNEDHYFVTRVRRSLETVLSNLPSGEVPESATETNYVMAVADGMGGCAAGDVASRMVISSLVELALEIPDWIFRADEAHAPEMQRRVRERVQKIGAMLFERGLENAELFGMGSTLTMARICEHDLLITHVGDSRAYLFRDARLERLTRDDTYAQMLVDLGKLETKDLSNSGVRHILTNALGGREAQVEVAIGLRHLESGDRLLLCSDGLSDNVDDGMIAEVLSSGQPSGESCARLLRLAVECGGRDDITAIVATVEFSSSTPPKSALRGIRSAAARLREGYRGW